MISLVKVIKDTQINMETFLVYKNNFFFKDYYSVLAKMYEEQGILNPSGKIIFLEGNLTVYFKSL